MSVNNPQHNNMKISKSLAIWQDVFGLIALFIAIVQGVWKLMSAKTFLVVTGTILVAEYLVSYLSSMYFDKGHVIREKGLLDNSFEEKRIPNYNSDEYYNNNSIDSGYIKLLANIHENALFTSRISDRMSKAYFIVSSIVSIFFLIKLFKHGMDDYTSILLGFIVSSSFFDRAIKIHSLKKNTEDVYDKANSICNSYEKKTMKSELILSNILELLLLYENAIFESKIILNQRLFNKLNDSLSEEWKRIRDSYLVYKKQNGSK